jgi:hypothetical protein
MDNTMDGWMVASGSKGHHKINSLDFEGRLGVNFINASFLHNSFFTPEISVV